METKANVRALVLDATPLITQSVSNLKTYAEKFFTCPTVFNEIKDENARRNLALWGDELVVRHPKQEYIKKVTDFSKLTGDYSVLSANDLHILALTYELEVEANGTKGLRKFPGEKLESEEEQKPKEKKTQTEAQADGWEPVKKKKTRRGGKKQREKRAAEGETAEGETAEGAVEIPVKVEVETPVETPVEAPVETPVEAPVETPVEAPVEAPVETPVETPVAAPVDSEPTEAEIQAALANLEIKSEDLQEEYDENDDDGEWITPENLTSAMIKDSGQDLSNAQADKAAANIGCALATGDFAVQNVALQVGLNLMNFMSGMRIKRVRNYMYRCHACFRMTPIPKDKPKHFCPSCGGYQTLLRCAVSIDSTTGEVVPHLKANFEWHTRGNRYSLASPLSKNHQKRQGNAGFVHNKTNKQREYEIPTLREDQKEYQQSMKQEQWTRRHNEKVLDHWIGGGSADNYMSPFAIDGLKQHVVKVGKGRFVNSSRGKRK